jgi:GntR family transcriptional regulator
MSRSVPREDLPYCLKAAPDGAQRALEQEDSGPGGGFARIDEVGEPLAEISEAWQARMPLSPESGLLGLPPGTPVLDLTRLVYDRVGRVVEMMLAVIAADTMTMHYRFPIPE